ncbi:MAG: hypothetical protein WA584_21725 [Pyrinomonadaceae bacterium]
MWQKIKKWLSPLMLSWFSFTLLSVPLISITLLQLTFQPTLTINVYNIPGVDGDKSKDPFSVSNSDGKQVMFSIWTLNDTYSWEFGYDGTSDDGYPAMLNKNNATLPISDEQKKSLNLAEEIICIGASSQEPKAKENDPKKARAIEESRASRRANSIASWIQPKLDAPINEDSFVVGFLKRLWGTPPPPNRIVKKLNIGQWEKQENRTQTETAYQRRVVIILVLRNEKGEYVSPDNVALRNAFLEKAKNEQKIYEYILNDYSKTKNGFAWE